ncbi:hypothetical protein P886_0850 [Alteromonadaceae bacterium 2753L.S.0a.02]|nr:hypothetical protein P886_0850 [Alteromonadaceae bacterium 2753L.S.0a.02]
MLKALFSSVAVVLTLIAFIPYIRAILNGDTKPHVFSWVIWGISTSVVFIAQCQAQGCVGAIPIGLSGFVTLVIALLAFFKRGDASITPMDWCFLFAAFSALPFWFATAEPLWAVVILTGVDLMGFGPTLRKAWHQPRDESLLFYSLFLVRNLLALAALESYSLSTVLFPLAIAAACALLITLIWTQRQRQL